MILAASPPARAIRSTPLIGFLGAGVYEEALFRLVLVPLFFGVLRLLQTPRGPGEHAGGDGLVAALLAGAPRRDPRRGVHLVRVHLPMAGRGLLRLGLRGPRVRHRGRHAYCLRCPGRLARLAPEITPLSGRCRPNAEAGRLRIVHLSDIHVWRYTLNPLRLMSKRAVGMVELLAGRARKFRLERLREVVERVSGAGARPRPDHRRPDDDGPARRVPRSAARPWPSCWPTRAG